MAADAELRICHPPRMLRIGRTRPARPQRTGRGIPNGGQLAQSALVLRRAIFCMNSFYPSSTVVLMGHDQGHAGRVLTGHT